MPQGRSPSGVASLRARFEQGQGRDENNTSPPSRGRSPAGSIGGDGTQPLSKVRTSFVAVEASGHMATTLEVPSQLDDLSKSSPKTGGVNGNAKRDANPAGQTINAEGNTTTAEAAQEQAADGITADTDPQVSAAQDGKSDMLSADPTDAGAGSGSDALPGSEPGLGSILKGSAFQSERDTTNAPATNTAARPSSAKEPSKGNKPSTIVSSAKGQLSKPASTTQPAKRQSTTASSAPQPAIQPKVPSAAKDKSITNGKPKEAAKPNGEEQTKAQPPSAIDTQAASSEADNAEHKTAKSPQTPCTPTTLNPSSKKSSAKVDSPKSAAPLREPRKGPSQPKNAIGKASERLSNAVKAPIEAAKSVSSKPSTSSNGAKPKEKAATTSPRGITKARPKSPTRPTRLPAAATAPTASSAAKHDAEGDAPTPRAPSRQSNVPAINKGRTAALSNPKKSVRASLPVNSRPIEKRESKPRASMASSGASTGSFLERMMRPTQSSAQKTHDKVEPSSPPRRKVSSSHPVKPKGKSEEVAPVKPDGKEPGEEEEQPLAGTTESKIDTTVEQPSAQSVPAADPTTAGANEVAKEIASAEPALGPEEQTAA